jgi:pseudaminic acid synthase
MADTTFQIGSRKIGPGHPCYIIAEMSANHGHSYDQALAILHASKEAGADAVKLQTYTPDTLTLDCDAPWFRVGKGTIWEGRNLYQLYKEAYTPWDWQPRLKQAAKDLGMDCFSSPFDATAVDFLEAMHVDCYKIASFELVDLPLIRKTAGTGKPMIMSTGMATLSEIEEAVRTAREAGCTQLALLKCNSGYPAPPEEMNLRTIPHMAEAFGVITGLSDHTLTTTVPVAAVTLGACIIEKHITLDRSIPGPDSAFSLEPHEFREMVASVRTTEKALGRVRYQPAEREMASRLFRKSLFVIRDIEAGEPFTEENVKCIRPGNGLHPRHWELLLRSFAKCPLKRGTPLEMGHLSALDAR